MFNQPTSYDDPHARVYVQVPRIQVHPQPEQKSHSTAWTPSPPLPTVQRFPSYDFTFESDYDSSSPTFLSPCPSFSSSPLSYTTPPRKAPLPPTYSPRRARARHIKMQEPAKLGLFTVEEDPEQAGDRPSWYSAASTPCSLTPSSTTSTTSSTSEDEHEVSTPLSEHEDPFALPYPSPSLARSVSVSVSASSPVPTLAAAVSAGTFRPRRPPPLALSLITRSDDLPSLDLESSVQALSPSPMSISRSLAPALPIRSRHQVSNSNSEQFNVSPQKRRSPDDELDLVSALEELLTTCGEDLSLSDSTSDYGVDESLPPMPPSRGVPRSPSITSSSSSSASSQGPVTPPPSHRRLIPSAPRQKQRKVSSTSTSRVGQHSFLFGLSTADSEMPGSRRSPSNSNTGSTSSTSSSRSLPRRGALPMEWTGNVV